MTRRFGLGRSHRNLPSVKRRRKRRRLISEILESRVVLSATIGNNIAVGGQVQNYRLAIAATAEYTALLGGQAQALAAIQTLSCHFDLVSGVETIFTDSANDGHTNDDVIPNLPPTLSLPSDPIIFFEGDSPLIVDPAATIGDADSADFDGGTLTVDFVSGRSANDVLSIRNQGTAAGEISVSGNDVSYGGIAIGSFSGGTASPLTVTFNANATPAAAQALLRNVQYSNSGTDLTPTPRVISAVVTDGDGGTGPNSIQEVTFGFALTFDGNGSVFRQEALAQAPSGDLFAVSQFGGTVDLDPGTGTLELTANGTRDGVIASYDSSGGLQWAKQLGGSGIDTAESVLVADNGDLIITGRFSGVVDFDLGPGVFNLDGGGTDYFILRLDSNGDFITAGQVEANIGDVSVDPSGNLLVAGQFFQTQDIDPTPTVFNFTTSGSNGDSFLMKTDPSLNLIWARRLDEVSGDYADSAGGIRSDVQGNVYVTGSFRGSIDLDPGAGVEEHTTSSSTDANPYTIKLTSTGDFVWGRTWGGTGSDSTAGVEIDAAGNLTFAGTFGDTGSGSPAASADFDPGPATFSVNSNGRADAYALKLSAEGDFVWVRTIGGPGLDSVVSFDLDDQGALNLGMYFDDTVDFDPSGDTFELTSNGFADAAVWGLTPQGDFRYAASHGGTSSDVVLDIATGQDGSLLSTGFFIGSSEFDPGPGVENRSGTGTTNGFIWKLNLTGVAETQTINVVPSTRFSILATDALKLEGAASTNTSFDFTVTRSGVTSGAASVDFTVAGSGADAATADDFGGTFPAGTINFSDGETSHVISVLVSGDVLVESDEGFTVSLSNPSGPAVITGSGSAEGTILDDDAPPNVPPVVTLPTAPITFNEKDPPVLLDPAATVTDIDSADFNGGSLTVEIVDAGSINDVLDVRDEGSGAGQVGVSGNTVTFGGVDIGSLVPGSGSSPLVVSFNANATPVAAQALLRNVTFWNGASSPSTSPRIVSAIVTDGDGGIAAGTDVVVELTSLVTFGGSDRDWGQSLAHDDSGNLYVAGMFAGSMDADPGPGTTTLTSAGGNDIFVASFDLDRNFRWAHAVGSTGTDQPRRILVDDSGLIQIGGFFAGTVDFDPGAGDASLTAATGGSNGFLWTLDAAGNHVAAINTGGDVNGLALDSAGNRIVAGTFRGARDFDPGSGVTEFDSGTSFDSFVSKIDASGNLLWTRYIGDGVNNSHDLAQDVVVDAAGNVYAGGSFTGTVDFDPGTGVFELSTPTTEPLDSDAFLLKLDSSGEIVWAKQWGGSRTAQQVKALALDSGETLYATGYHLGNSDFDPGSGVFNLTSRGSADVFVSKFNLDGEFSWAASAGGDESDSVNDVAVDRYGNVVVPLSFRETVDFDPSSETESRTSRGSFDGAVWILDPAGNLVSVETYGGNGGVTPYGVAIDDAGRVISTGSFSGATDFDPTESKRILDESGFVDVYVQTLDIAAVETQTINVIDLPDDDFGDAPAPYATAETDNGARHRAVGPQLGASRDTEVDGLPSIGANADDAAGDDEDGVLIAPLLIGDGGASLQIDAQQIVGGTPTYLNAWIDFNQDGSWGGPLEKVANGVLLTSGINNVTFEIPATALAGSTYARFRISTTQFLAPGGFATDGEVEDHVVQLIPTGTTHSFAAAQTVGSIASAQRSTVVDVNGDGHVDVFSVSFDNEIAWFQNDGSANFTKRTISSSGGISNGENALGDLDGDGDMDFVNAGSTGLAWYQNDGSENFTRIVIDTNDDGEVVAADFDSDGDLDLVMGAQLYRNDGSGTFAVETLAGVTVETSSAADVDSDGDIDVFGTHRLSDQAAWLRNDGTGNFTQVSIAGVGDDPNVTFADDLDRDGDVDLVVGLFAGTEVFYYENDGSENFTRRSVTTSIGPIRSVQVADVDGDGHRDIIASSRDFGPYVFFNDGTQTFLASALGPVASFGDSAAGDFDGDGDLDIAAAAGSGVVYWYDNLAPQLPTLSIIATDSTNDEGETGFTDFTFTVLRGGDTSVAVTADYTVGGLGTMPADATDFGGTFPSGTVSFDAGETSQSITVQVAGDSAVEDNEAFQVTLSNPSGSGVIGAATAAGLIVNDDVPMLTVDVTDDSVSESDGTNATTVTVTRNTDPTDPLIVSLRSSAPDELSVPPTVTIAAGQASVTIPVDAVDDSIFDGDQAVTVTADTVPRLVLDNTFSDDGIQSIGFIDGGGQIGTNPHQVVQPDGKLITAYNKSYIFNVRRHLENGEVDTTFGTEGRVLLNLFSGVVVSQLVADVILQDDGKIVVAGTYGNSSDGFNLFLVRLNHDGSLDTSFGTGGSVIRSNSLDESARGLLEQAGKYVVIGHRGSAPTLWRFNGDGSLDTTFGTNGLRAIPAGGSAITEGFDVQADGKIVVTGTGGVGGSDRHLFVARVLPDGEMDVAFAAGGVAIVDSADASEGGGDVAITADQRIIVAGYQEAIAGDPDPMLVRFNSDGSIDTSFGTNGFSIFGAAFRADEAQLIEINDDGLLIVGINASENNEELRVHGPDGMFLTEVTDLIPGASYSQLGDLVLQGDGKILVSRTGIGIYRFDKLAYGDFVPDSDTVTVADDEIGKLSLDFGSFETSFPEVTENKTIDFDVVRTGSLVGDLTVTLTSGDETELTVPATVVIPDGQSRLTVTASGVQDGFFDGTRAAYVRANAPQFEEGAQIVRILDDAVPRLTLSVSPSSVSEDGGQATLTVVRYGFREDPLTVTLSGNDASELSVPATISFDAGVALAQVVLTGVDDVLFDGTQTVTVSATWEAQNVTETIDVDVLDDEATPLAITNDDAPTTSYLEDTGQINLTVTRGGDTSAELTVDVTVDLPSDVSVPPTITFAAGSATAALVATPIADSVVEPDEAFEISVGTVGVTEIDTFAGTVLNDDINAISVSVDPASIAEDAAGVLTFTLTRDNTSAETPALAVGIELSGTATGGDYIATDTTTVNFAAGANTAVVQVDPTVDTIVEFNETVILTVTEGIGYDVGSPASAVATIGNDDVSTVVMSVSPIAIEEDAEGVLTYTFTRDNTSAESPGLAINLVYSGTASADDYSSSVSTRLLFQAGANTAIVEIDPTADSLVEPDETVILSLAAGQEYNIGTPSSAVGIISNDDSSTVSVAVDPLAMDEDASGVLTYTFTRDNTSAETPTLAINFDTTGTATADDYSVTETGTVTFAAGASTATVEVDPTADATIEPDETVILAVSAGAGYDLGVPSSATGTISDDDDVAVITIDVAPASVVEDGTESLVYTLTRTGGTTNEVAVNFIASGTATPGADYPMFATASVTFAPGAATTMVVVDPTADSVVEGNETVTLTLADGVGYTVGTANSATATIIDDDTASVSVEDATALEGIGIEFTVTLDNPVQGSFNVTAMLPNITATFGTDYDASSHRMTFAGTAGETQTFTVPTIDDALVEGDETFLVSLSTSNSLVTSSDAAIGTIGDNDDASLIIEDVSEVEGIGLTFTVTLDAAVTIPFNVVASMTDGSATGAVDYNNSTVNLSFIGMAGETRQFTVTTTDDDEFEDAENFNVSLVASTAFVDDSDTAVGTIINDDLSSLPPKVERVVYFNQDAEAERGYSPDSTGQRSIIRQIQVTFSGPVTVPIGVVADDSFVVESTDDWSKGKRVGLEVVASELVEGKQVVLLTFTGRDQIEPISRRKRSVNAMLVDGRYRLTIDGQKLGIDANGGDFGAKATDEFFRLFGDTDGDRDVDSDDQDRFFAFYEHGSHHALLDFDARPEKKSVDRKEFVKRFGVRMF